MTDPVITLGNQLHDRYHLSPEQAGADAHEILDTLQYDEETTSRYAVTLTEAGLSVASFLGLALLRAANEAGAGN